MFQDDGRSPSWICKTPVWTAHEEYWSLCKIWFDSSSFNNTQVLIFWALALKMPIHAPFGGGSEFPAICNHCRVVMAWSRKTWKFCEQFLRFLEKRPLMVKFSKFCSESFHHLTDRRCCVEMSYNFSDGKSCVIYRTKKNNNKILAPSTVATARIAPKICQG